MGRMIQHWAEYFWPGRCVLCGAPGQHRPLTIRDLCEHCQQDMPVLAHCCETCGRPTPTPVAVCGACQKHKPAFDYIRSAFMYAPPVDWLLGRFKFNAQVKYGRVLAQLLTDSLSIDERPDVVVPVPLHGSRLRQRGFNQALELFRPLVTAQGIPLSTRLCIRARPTSAQAGLDGKDRRKNVRGAFAVRGDCKGMHVVIVDDVVTTGSTVAELARILKRAGARRVGVWSLARTVNHHGS